MRHGTAILLLFLSGLVMSDDTGRIELEPAPLSKERTACHITWHVPTRLFPEGLEGFSLTEPLSLEGWVKGEEALTFRYAFYPEIGGESVALRFERHLEPGNRRINLRLFMGEQTLLETTETLAVPTLAPSDDDHEISLLLQAESALYHGRGAFQVTTRGEGIASVRYLLNGKEIGSAKKPPYRTKLKLGGPKVMKLSAEALSAEGEVLARDTVQLNAGPYAFDVRLVEPIPDTRQRGLVRVRATARPPLGMKIERLDFFLDDQPIASVFGPPYSLRIPVPDALATVRVVGHVDSRTVDEDSVLVNPPPGMEQIEVRNIELYVSVEDRLNETLDYLEEESFAVFENDQPVEILEFVPGEDRPLYMSFLIDISGSMGIYLPKLTEGAQELVDALLGPGDRVSLSLFREKPELLTSFTSNKYYFMQGLRDLEDESAKQGYTAFHDGVITALYDLSGIEGRRALLIFSDGMDNASRFSRFQVNDFARQAGVRFYIFHTVTSSLQGRDPWLKRLAEETGGGYYNINNPQYMETFFRKIQKDMATQYLIRYQTTRDPDDQACREIRVEILGEKARARTIKGWCP